jgi:serine/threonine protein phosphatase PrpC
MGEFVEENNDSYKEIEEHTTLTSMVSIENQDQSISFMLLCSDGVSEVDNFLESFYEHVKNINASNIEEFKELLKIRIDKFVNNCVYKGQSGDDATIAFILFRNQNVDLRGSYKNFQETLFSKTFVTNV